MFKVLLGVSGERIHVLGMRRERRGRYGRLGKRCPELGIWRCRASMRCEAADSCNTLAWRYLCPQESSPSTASLDCATVPWQLGLGQGDAEAERAVVVAISGERGMSVVATIMECLLGLVMVNGLFLCGPGLASQRNLHDDESTPARTCKGPLAGWRRLAC